MTTYEIVTTALVPVSSIVSWIAGTRMRRNSAITAMQTTINMLAEKNNELYAENMELRREISGLKDNAAKRDLRLLELEQQIERLHQQ
jgi:cell division protein FtsB